MKQKGDSTDSEQRIQRICTLSEIRSRDGAGLNTGLPWPWGDEGGLNLWWAGESRTTGQTLRNRTRTDFRWASVLQKQLVEFGKTLAFKTQSSSSEERRTGGAINRKWKKRKAWVEMMQRYNVLKCQSELTNRSEWDLLQLHSSVFVALNWNTDALSRINLHLFDCLTFEFWSHELIKAAGERSDVPTGRQQEGRLTNEAERQKLH